MTLPAALVGVLVGFGFNNALREFGVVPKELPSRNILSESLGEHPFNFPSMQNPKLICAEFPSSFAARSWSSVSEIFLA